MRISIAGNLCRQCRSTTARICTDRLFCCTAQDRPDSLPSPSLTQLLMILWKGRSWNRYAIVRRKHGVTMKSRTWFTQVCAVQVFMPFSLQIGIKYSHTTTSAPQELTAGMTVVSQTYYRLKDKIVTEQWLTLELTVPSVELWQTTLNGDST